MSSFTQTKTNRSQLNRSRNATVHWAGGLQQLIIGPKQMALGTGLIICQPVWDKLKKEKWRLMAKLTLGCVCGEKEPNHTINKQK